MRYFVFVMLLAACLKSGWVSANDKINLNPILINSENLTCSKWAADRKTGGDSAKKNAEWVYGFFSGYNAFYPAPKRAFLQQDANSILNQIDIFCAANPKQRVSTASINFLNAFCEGDAVVRAQDIAQGIRTWEDIYQWYQNYKRCDASGSKSSVLIANKEAELIAAHWNEFSSLVALTEQDANFRFFVLSYLSLATNKEFLKLGVINTQNFCTQKNKKLCRNVKAHMKMALEE